MSSSINKPVIQSTSYCISASISLAACWIALAGQRSIAFSPPNIFRPKVINEQLRQRRNGRWVAAYIGLRSKTVVRDYVRCSFYAADFTSFHFSWTHASSWCLLPCASSVKFCWQLDDSFVVTLATCWLTIPPSPPTTPPQAYGWSNKIETTYCRCLLLFSTLQFAHVALLTVNAIFLLYSHFKLNKDV